MNSNSTMSVVLAVATLLTFLTCVGGLVWSFFIPSLIMGLACAALAVMFGLMVRNDYYKFFQQK